jgi:hypothetical protein
MLYQLMMSISSADVRLQEHYGRTMSSLVCHMSSLSHYLQLGDECGICVARHRWQNTNVPELFELLCHLPLFTSLDLTPDKNYVFLAEIMSLLGLPNSTYLCS